MNIKAKRAATNTPTTRNRMIVRGADGSPDGMTRSTTDRLGRIRGVRGSDRRGGFGVLGFG
jgi:hypothetical protein